MEIVLQLVLIGLLALVIAIIGNIAGFGGGVFLVPSLILLFDIEGAVSVASILIAMIIPVIIGSFGAWRRDEVDFKMGIVFGIPSAIGAFLGALSLGQIPEIIIVIFISVVASIFGIRIIIITARRNKNGTDKHDDTSKSMIIWKKINSLKPIINVRRNDKSYEVSLPIAVLIGLTLGLIAGLFGVSGGWIQVPIFIIFFGLDPLLASGTSLFIIVIKATAGAITYIVEGSIAIDWWIVLSLVVGMSIGVVIGHWLKGKLKTKYVSYIVGVVLLLIVIFTVISTALQWGT
ncbi:MAG: sulfite exporter TauE/SafE family protein [Candidatus Heimdallarchaeota archaeon]|nr:sulfite exporter TauE/SafE family protein [Candidatus Heimdallarchaeota archaeon]MCK5143257.1 sulfite exporter TauE/SafE family protein [Candidatus Heimdallarchaeota archaeon]